MASGEAEPLLYTTTALRVSIHCEGCKKKVKKVLHGIEGVYKVTVDAAQHKVTVTGSVEADALVRRLHKAGKQAALWPSPAPPPAPVAEAKKPEEAAPAAQPAAAGDSGAKEAADAKPKDKTPPEKGEGKEKKPGAKDKGSDNKKADKGEAAAKTASKDAANKDGEVVAEPKETKKGSPEPAKQQDAAAEEAGAEEPGGGGGGKKGKKNKKNNKAKDGAEDEAPAPAAPDATAAAPEKKAPPQQPSSVLAPSPGPERPPHGGFPYYAAQPVLSYNVAHPSSSVSYYAPTPAVPMHPMPPPPPHVVPYGYPPYPTMVPVPAEYLYGPPGMRSSPPQESYNNMFNEDNANSCSLM